MNNGFVLLLIPIAIFILVKLMSYDLDEVVDESQASAPPERRTPAARALTVLHRKLTIALAIHPLVGVLFAALLSGGSAFSRLMLSLPPSLEQ